MIGFEQFLDSAKPEVWKDNKKEDETLLKVPTSPRSMA